MPIPLGAIILHRGISSASPSISPSHSLSPSSSESASQSSSNSVSPSASSSNSSSPSSSASRSISSSPSSSNSRSASRSTSSSISSSPSPSTGGGGSGLWPANAAAVGPRGALTVPGIMGTGWQKTGSIISTTAAGARLNSADMSGLGLIVKHDDCIVTDARILGSAGVRNVYIWNTGTNCQLNYCEFGNSNFTAIGPDQSFTHGWTGTGLIVDHCLFQNNMENAINCGTNNTVRDSVIRRFGVGGAPHYDGIEEFGGENSITVERCVIFLTSDGSGADAGAIDTFLPDTGCVNLFGNINDFCMVDSLIGGGSSCLNFDDGGGSPGNTNVRIGVDRSGVAHPCYYVRNTAGQIFRDDTGLTIAGWNLRFAENDPSNVSTYNQTLTTSQIASP